MYLYPAFIVCGKSRAWNVNNLRVHVWSCLYDYRILGKVVNNYYYTPQFEPSKERYVHVIRNTSSLAVGNRRNLGARAPLVFPPVLLTL